MRLVTQDAGAGGDRAVEVLFFHERLILVAKQTQVFRGVCLKDELKIALMRIMAVGTAAIRNRFVEVVFFRYDMAFPA